MRCLIYNDHVQYMILVREKPKAADQVIERGLCNFPRVDRAANGSLACGAGEVATVSKNRERATRAG